MRLFLWYFCYTLLLLRFYSTLLFTRSGYFAVFCVNIILSVAEVYFSVNTELIKSFWSSVCWSQIVYFLIGCVVLQNGKRWKLFIFILRRYSIQRPGNVQFKRLKIDSKYFCINRETYDTKFRIFIYHLPKNPWWFSTVQTCESLMQLVHLSLSDHLCLLLFLIEFYDFC